jgi:general secretion pathway protein H
LEGAQVKIQGSRLTRGFTLIEMLVVLLIIGLSLGLVGILVNRGTGGLELRRFARDISSVLRYARSQAVSEKKMYSFIVQKSDMTYAVYSSYTADEETEEPLILKTIPENLKLIFNGRDMDMIRIDFSPLGNSTGGTLMIEDQRGERLFISVNRVNGKVEVTDEE